MATVDNDDGGWPLVAERLDQEIRARGLSLRSIETATGVNYRTIQKLLDGEPVTRRDRLAVLARYFGWPADAFDRIRRGEDPQDVTIDASSVDLEELRRTDPEAYEQIMGMARIALDRARERKA